MSTVEVTTKVNITQLSSEMGGVALWGSVSDGVYTISSDVEQSVLEAAIAAHVPINEDVNKLSIEDKLGINLTDLASSVTTLDAVLAKTNAQIGGADTKNVAREARLIAQVCQRLIKHVLNDFSTGG